MAKILYFFNYFNKIRPLVNQSEINYSDTAPGVAFSLIVSNKKRKITSVINSTVRTIYVYAIGKPHDISVTISYHDESSSELPGIKMTRSAEKIYSQLRFLISEVNGEKAQ